PGALSVRVEAFRRGGGCRLRRALGRTWLELVHPGRPLPGRGHLYQPASRPRSLGADEPELALHAVPAWLPLPGPGALWLGGQPVREGHEAAAYRPALGLVRQGSEEGVRTTGRAACPGECRSRGAARRRPCGTGPAGRRIPGTASAGRATSAARASSGQPRGYLEGSALRGPVDRTDSPGRWPVRLGSGQQGPEAV